MSDVCKFSKIKFNAQMLSWEKGGLKKMEYGQILV